MIHVVGKYQEIELDTVGSRSFPIARVKIDVNGRPVQLTAKGDVAERTAVLLEHAPAGILIEVHGDTEYRATNDGRVFMDPVVNEVFLLGNVGEPAGNFKIQGFVSGMREIERKNNKGSFWVANIAEIKFGREGYIEGAELEVTLPDNDTASWNSALGKFVFVRGEFGGYESQTGRVWPRFNAREATFYPVMPWLEEYAPEVDPPESMTADEEPMPF